MPSGLRDTNIDAGHRRWGGYPSKGRIPVTTIVKVPAGAS